MRHHTKMGCNTIVGNNRKLPSEGERWTQYDEDKMGHNEIRCPVVCHAGFECFCMKENQHNNDDNVETNGSSTTSYPLEDSTQTPPH